MKTVTSAILLVLLVACNKTAHDNPALHLSLVNDVTDSLRLRVEENSILQRFNLSQHKADKVIFSYSEISNTRLSKTVNIVLPGEGETDEKNNKNEPFFREKMILAFYDTIRHTLSDAKAEQGIKPNSECFRAICKQLQALAASRSSEKLMIITSNLFENSTLLNVYGKRFENYFWNHPDEIDSLFERTGLLPDHLQGITVIIIYQPYNRDDDKRFAVMAEVYTRLLKKRGARVVIQADNKNYQG